MKLTFEEKKDKEDLLEKSMIQTNQYEDGKTRTNELNQSFKYHCFFIML